MNSSAFISDIHSNLEALTAVLEDIDHHGYEEIFCLGDLVGYGPDPVACTDLVQERCRVTLLGNHEEALLKGTQGFNRVALSSIEWTREQLRPRFYRLGSRRRWEFLTGLPLRYQWEDFLLVHGSPREPTTEYIFPRDAEWDLTGKFEAIFGSFKTVCLVAHTHYAGVFKETQGIPQKEVGDPFRKDVDFIPQKEVGDPFRFEGKKLIINVGSVGQPRDENWRACYLSIENNELFRFHRVEYPVEVTQKKIAAIDALDNSLADRLRKRV